jgi:peptide/nickel transport system permease protein
MAIHNCLVFIRSYIIGLTKLIKMNNTWKSFLFYTFVFFKMAGFIKTRPPRESPGKMAWGRFKRNPTAMAGLLWIILSVFLAVAGYLITPDPTPFANHQQLEIATEKPGFSAAFLFIRKNISFRGTPVWRKMLFGSPLPYTTIPVQSWSMDGEVLEYETWSGADGYPGLAGEASLWDVAYALPGNGQAEKTPDGKFQITDLNGDRHLVALDALQERVREEHIRTRRFLLGTDRFGRDMLSQLIIGTRVSLSVGFIAVIISLVIGISLGSLAGFFRGRLDDLIVWLINVVWSIPTLLLVIAITFALGKGFWQVFVAVGLTMWVEVARLVRGQVISIREKEFVESARALGLGNFRIIRRHILPNVMGPVVVISAANFASAILIEAGLSFLGIGVQPPMPSWGTMIREHYGYIILDKAYLAVLPGLCIMFMVLAFMLVGNGLREATDRLA